MTKHGILCLHLRLIHKAFYFKPLNYNFQISLHSTENDCHFFENKDTYPGELAV